jgi:hypothetical protein
MKKSTSLKILSMATFLTFSLSACGLGSNSSSTKNDSDSPSKVENTFAKVSKTEFDSALQNVDITRDEFKGNFEIVGKGSTTVKVGNSIISLSLSLTREDSNSDWQGVLLSGYGGLDWMFHNEWNLKSDKGILNVDINSNIRDDQVESGFVSEIALYDPSQEEIIKFCEITSGTNVKFRLRGSSGNVKDVTGEMTQSALDDARDICNIYSGLKQGFEITS